MRLSLEDGRVVSLKGAWYWFWTSHCNTLVHAGDPVNLVLAREEDAESPMVTCGGTGNFLIFHPSILLSGTTISNALPCQRKTLLQHLLSDVGYGAQNNIYATVGNAVHTIIQNSLMFGRVDEAFVRHVVDSAKMDLWFSGFSSTSMLERHVRERVPQVAQWLTEVVPKKFSRLIAAEQNVNCRKFGLKGKIDAVVETAAGGQQGLTCLEIKTGKPWHTHLGQVTLYHLLMMDLYSEEGVGAGRLEVGYFNGNRNLRGPPGGGAAAPACAEINEVRGGGGRWASWFRLAGSRLDLGVQH